MQKTIAVLALVSLVAIDGRPAAAQNAGGADTAPFPYLLITREEVRAGKGVAHGALEAQWAAAMTKGQSPSRWLGMTAMLGASDAWFLSGYRSYADWAKADAGLEAMAALKAENDRFSGLDGDLLTRTSTTLAQYRSDLSYQPSVSLPRMRYMMVDVMRVKPGQGPAFSQAWRMQVAAHQTAKMDEHWAVYQVVGGGLDGTFLFFYPMVSLEEMDASDPMHVGDAYRAAVGENGRMQMRELQRSSMESSQTLLFQLRPEMSVLSPEWASTDAFWAVKPPATATASRKPGGQE